MGRRRLESTKRCAQPFPPPTQGESDWTVGPTNAEECEVQVGEVPFPLPQPLNRPPSLLRPRARQSPGHVAVN